MSSVRQKRYEKMDAFHKQIHVIQLRFLKAGMLLRYVMGRLGPPLVDKIANSSYGLVLKIKEK